MISARRGTATPGTLGAVTIRAGMFGGYRDEKTYYLEAHPCIPMLDAGPLLISNVTPMPGVLSQVRNGMPRALPVLWAS